MAGKPKNVKRWVSHSPSQYLDAANILVTHSNKATHFKAPPGGVRVRQKVESGFPYVCVSINSAAQQEVPLDRAASAAQNLVVEQILFALNAPSAQPFADANQEEIEFIRREIGDVIGQHYVHQPDHVYRWLSQIIVQDANGKDLALTPLHSAGLSHAMKKTFQEHMETLASSKSRYRVHHFSTVEMPRAWKSHVSNICRPGLFRAICQAYRLGGC